MRKSGILTVFFIIVALSLTFLPLPPAAADEIENTREFYSRSYDGYCYMLEADTYALARNTPIADHIITDTLQSLVGQKYDHGAEYDDYTVLRSYLYFDTSAIPDNANITSAKLRLYIHLDDSDADFNVTIQNGQPTYPHVPLVVADYNLNYYSGNGGYFDTSGVALNSYNNITLSATGLSWISLTGRTKLCLRNDKEINNIVPSDGVPESVGFRSSEMGAGYLPILEVTYDTPVYLYMLQGAYNEEGVRDGAINCTFFPPAEAPETFELDGTYNVTAEHLGSLLTFDIGFNESRTYHLYLEFEEIYVMKPTDPYYYYYFSVVDFIGLEWGYLESLVNFNGTDKVCERQTTAIMNNIPFTFSWGRSYKMRLVCDVGEYLYGSYVAGATTEFTLAITSDMFPATPTDIGDLTVSATRKNVSWIQAVYVDAESKTSWVNFDFHEYGNTTALYSYNTTSNSVVVNWYEAATDTDYYVVVTISHLVLGTKTWTFPCPAPAITEPNPFTVLRLLGDFPFDAAQIPAVLIIIVVMLAFTWWNAPMGIIATVLVSFLLAWIGWLAVGWTWLTISGSLCFILALAMKKDREPRI